MTPTLCQTPTRGWLNLAYARRVQFRKIHIHQSWRFTCCITWSNGEKETFFDKDASAIVQTLEKLTLRLRSLRLRSGSTVSWDKRPYRTNHARLLAGADSLASG